MSFGPAVMEGLDDLIRVDLKLVHVSEAINRKKSDQEKGKLVQTLTWRARGITRVEDCAAICEISSVRPWRVEGFLLEDSNDSWGLMCSNVGQHCPKNKWALTNVW